MDLKGRCACHTLVAWALPELGDRELPGSAEREGVARRLRARPRRPGQAARTRTDAGTQGGGWGRGGALHVVSGDAIALRGNSLETLWNSAFYKGMYLRGKSKAVRMGRPSRVRSASATLHGPWVSDRIKSTAWSLGPL